MQIVIPNTHTPKRMLQVLLQDEMIQVWAGNNMRIYLEKKSMQY